jgi:hypothetical protein
MAKRDIYDVRFVTGDGPDGYFAKLTPDEFEKLKETLAQYSATGDITEAEIRLIDENLSLSFDQLNKELENRFGALEKGRPDASRVDVRLDPKTEQMVRDLLVAAFEGGSNYWYRIEGKKLPPGTKIADFKEGGRMQPQRGDGSEDYYNWAQLIPTIPGGQIVIREVGEGEGDTYVLDLPAIRKALMLFKQQYPQKYKRVVEHEDYDASDGDIFLQLALFDKVIFG